MLEPPRQHEASISCVLILNGQRWFQHLSAADRGLFAFRTVFCNGLLQVAALDRDFNDLGWPKYTASCLSRRG